jgi:hypothetical protein
MNYNLANNDIRLGGDLSEDTAYQAAYDLSQSN